MQFLFIRQIWVFVSGSMKDPKQRSKTLIVLLIAVAGYGVMKYDAWRTQQIKDALSTSQLEKQSLQRALTNLQTLTQLDDIIAREVTRNMTVYKEQTDGLLQQVLDDVRDIQTDVATEPTGSLGERIVLERETIREVPVATRSDRVAERLLIGMWDTYCRDPMGDPGLCTQRNGAATD